MEFLCKDDQGPQNLEHVALAQGGLPANLLNLRLLWQLAARELGYDLAVSWHIMQERMA